MRQALTRNGLAAAKRPEATRRPESQRAGAGAELHRPNTRPPGEPNRGSYPFGAPPSPIYRPARSVMQAGEANARSWVLEFEPRGRRWIEPLMGWTATDDLCALIRLTFPTLAAAVGYAERAGLDCNIIDPLVRQRVHKDYRVTINGPGLQSTGAAQPSRVPASWLQCHAAQSNERQSQTMEVIP